MAAHCFSSPTRRFIREFYHKQQGSVCLEAASRERELRGSEDDYEQYPDAVCDPEKLERLKALVELGETEYEALVSHARTQKEPLPDRPDFRVSKLRPLVRASSPHPPLTSFGSDQGHYGGDLA